MHRCIVSTHVDDGRAMYNHRPFYDDLVRTLETRYGPLSKDDNTTSYTGTTFLSDSSGAFQIAQEGYINRLLSSVNLPNLPIRSTPSILIYFLTRVLCLYAMLPLIAN